MKFPMERSERAWSRGGDSAWKLEGEMRVAGTNMEDEKEEESDFEVINRTKSSSMFESISQTQYRANVKQKRVLPLSLKSTRYKKKACSIRTFLESKKVIKKQDENFDTSDEKDQLTFCPICQLPFVSLIGQSVEGHVQECVINYSESSSLCPSGINCNSVTPCHFTQYSHQRLASLRSVKIATNKTNKEEIQNAESTDSQVIIQSTEAYLNSSLTNYSNNTNTPNARTNDTMVDTAFCLNNSSQSIINSTKKIEQASPILKNNFATESSIKSETHSSENWNEVNQWLNDSLEYKDFDMNIIEECTPTLEPANFPNIDPAKCVAKSSSITSAVTTSNTVTYVSTTSNTATNVSKTLSEETSRITSMDSSDKLQCHCPESNDKLFTFNKSHAETQKQIIKTNSKQMDISVYFGLKPKTGDTSNKVFQQKKLPNEQAQCSDARNSTRQTKKCPFYKIIEGTSFTVDAFSYGHIPGISAYFLSHFHYDHYGGLKRSFSKPIYCSKITANLISLKIKVAARFIHPLSLNTPTVIENIEVTLLEANHCPGAVMFIFKLPNGQTHLHTGDFRASTAMEEHKLLNCSSIYTLYLDTTYCDPSYSFPPQSETVEYCVSVATEAVTRNANTLIVVGTYTIGKEKIFIAVANALRCKVAVQRDKYNVLQCLESEHLKRIITQNYKDAQVHVLPMAHLVHKKLSAYLETCSSRYSELLAFKPTGWTFTNSYANDLQNIRPSKRASVTIYGVPYSEHSSYTELKQFVQYFKPRKILPTVNNGSATRREEMKNIFKNWLGN